MQLNVVGGNKNKAEAQDEQRRLCTSRIRTVALRGQTYAKSSTQYLHTNVIRMPALRVCVCECGKYFCCNFRLL